MPLKLIVAIFKKEWWSKWIFNCFHFSCFRVDKCIWHMINAVEINSSISWSKVHSHFNSINSLKTTFVFWYLLCRCIRIRAMCIFYLNKRVVSHFQRSHVWPIMAYHLPLIANNVVFLYFWVFECCIFHIYSK